MLTQKQEKFVQELIKGKSQREAYRNAYGCEGWKPSTIDSKASTLFKNGKVKERYEELMQKSIAKTEDTAESMRAFIIDQLKKIASGEIGDETTEYDAEGNILRKKMTTKAADKKDALSKLADYYGVTPEVNVQHDVNVTFVDSLEGYCE